MSFQFRFPHALLDFIGEGDKMESPIMRAGVEKARDWAIPIDGERRKKPTLSEAETYIRELINERSFYEGLGHA